MNTARKGAHAEQIAIKRLVGMGYIAARSAASKGPIDVFGIPVNQHASEPSLLVQVKCNRWPGPEERDELIAIARGVNDAVAVEVWMRIDGAPSKGGCQPKWIMRPVEADGYWGDRFDTYFDEREALRQYRKAKNK